ncbi:hypothetical protein DRN58_10030 [Thermococci archaeon]|nr:MAG: hypothetical protein DRN58_10030 [Thermococci archaeon]
MDENKIVLDEKYLEHFREDLKKLRETSKNVFAEQSDSYKQKLVYCLLNTIKSGDREKFMSILFRSVNARKEKAKDFAENFGKLQNLLKTKQFEDIAYAVVLGIMSSYKETKTEE